MKRAHSSLSHTATLDLLGKRTLLCPGRELFSHKCPQGLFCSIQCSSSPQPIVCIYVWNLVCVRDSAPVGSHLPYPILEGTFCDSPEGVPRPWEHVNILSSPVGVSYIYIFKYIVGLHMAGSRRGPSLTDLFISAPKSLFSKYSIFILFATSGPHAENGYPETENVAQLVACLPGRHKGLGSLLSTQCLYNPVWWHTPVISELQSSDKRIMSSGSSPIT